MYSTLVHIMYIHNTYLGRYKNQIHNCPEPIHIRMGAYFILIFFALFAFICAGMHADGNNIMCGMRARCVVHTAHSTNYHSFHYHLLGQQHPLSSIGGNKRKTKKKSILYPIVYRRRSNTLLFHRNIRNGIVPIVERTKRTKSNLMH